MIMIKIMLILITSIRNAKMVMRVATKMIRITTMKSRMTTMMMRTTTRTMFMMALVPAVKENFFIPSSKWKSKRTAASHEDVIILTGLYHNTTRSS